jgi:hypothetical protein
MRWIREDEIRSYLRANGLASGKAISDVLDGFDLDQIIQYRLLEEPDRLFQYIRKPSFKDLSPHSGRFFCLAGATQSRLAIVGGLAGRRLHRFEVLAPLTVIEGTAKRQDDNLDIGIGGEGGATQIYVPPNLLGHLAAVASVDHW